MLTLVFAPDTLEVISVHTNLPLLQAMRLYAGLEPVMSSNPDPERYEPAVMGVPTVCALVNEVGEKILEAYPLPEILSWPFKVREAQEILSTGNTNGSPLITTEATLLDVSPQDLAADVVSRSKQFLETAGKLAALRSRYIHQAQTLTNIRDLFSMRDALVEELANEQLY